MSGDRLVKRQPQYSNIPQWVVKPPGHATRGERVRERVRVGSNC